MLRTMLKKPGAAVFAAKTVEKSKRAQRGFLHHVLGVLIVAHEKPRQAVGRVEMRQDLALELRQARGLGESEHVSFLSLIKNKTAKV